MASCFRVFVVACLATAAMVARPAQPPLDRAAERWIEQTRKTLTLDEKIDQFIVPCSNRISSAPTATHSTTSRASWATTTSAASMCSAGRSPRPPVLLNTGTAR
jgi:hypothetical protein